MSLVTLKQSGRCGGRLANGRPCRERILEKSTDGQTIIHNAVVKILTGGKKVAVCKSCKAMVELPDSVFPARRVVYVVTKKNKL